MVSPVAANIEVPIIEKKGGQVISMTQNNVQVMDMQTFGVFDVAKVKRLNFIT
jgi:translation initiation factor 5A